MLTMNIYDKFARLQGPFFVLAPMDDVTDSVFRQVVQQTGLRMEPQMAE